MMDVCECFFTYSLNLFTFVSYFINLYSVHLRRFASNFVVQYTMTIKIFYSIWT